MNITRTRRSFSHSTRFALLAAMIAVVGGGSSVASAQLKKEKDKKKPPAAQPGQPDSAQPGKTPMPTEPIAEKVLIREKDKDWTFKLQIDIQSGAMKVATDKTVTRELPDMEFQSVAIVFPVIESSAAHKLRPGETGERISGEFVFADSVVDGSPTVADGYQSGTKLARWEGRDLKGKHAKLTLTLEMDCFETRYDDALAETIPWPKSYPPVATSALKPQMFVDYVVEPTEKSTVVADWLKKQIEGKDPKSLPPAKLAKFLAGRVMESVQVSGDGIVHNSDSRGLSGTMKGFDLRGAAATLTEGKGSEHDAACVLAAVYKAAGIPARTVIGYDVFDQKSGDSGLGGKPGRGKFRSWVEFCLVDPVSFAEIWVPVDVARMRKASSRAKPLDLPWKYFGDNDELAYVLPLAFQYHPPTTVTNEVPALWGWLTNPGSRPYANTFQFTAFRAAKRGDDVKRDKREGR